MGKILQNDSSEGLHSTASSDEATNCLPEGAVTVFPLVFQEYYILCSKSVCFKRKKSTIKSSFTVEILDYLKAGLRL